jgi:putative transcriptional regulator
LISEKKMKLQGTDSELDDMAEGQSAHSVDHLLASYAAGHVASPLAILVETHLFLRPDSRRFVAGLEALGGMHLHDIEPVPLSDRDARLKAIIEADDPPPIRARLPGHGNGHAHGLHANGHRASRNPNVRTNGSTFPGPLGRYVGHDVNSIPWKSRLPGLKEFRIEERDGFTASLLWIRAGKPMPNHTHEGTETTLVLAGGFSDLKGHYVRGDIALCDNDDDHRPIADDDGEDCLCFAVVDAPLRLTGPIGRIVQRFVR